jgi:hypothetical protein
MPWVRVTSDDGKKYYMNEDDDTTAWKLPEGMTDAEIESYASSEDSSSSDEEAAAAAPAAAPSAGACPWVRVTPEGGGKKYYMNTADDSTAWTLPEGFTEEQVKDYVSSDDESSDEEDDAAAAAPKKKAAGDCPWVRVTPDGGGKKYYMNTADDSTAWTLPEGFTEEQVKDYESSEGSESDSEEESVAAAPAAAAAVAKSSGSSSANSTAAAPLRAGATVPQRLGSCAPDWIAHGDGLGEDFYVNPRTGESEMSKPEGFDAATELQLHFLVCWDGSSWDSIVDDSWFAAFAEKRDERVKQILRIQAGDEEAEEEEEEELLEDAKPLTECLKYVDVGEMLSCVDFRGADAQAERAAMLAGRPDRCFGRMHVLLLLMRAQPRWGGWRSYIAGEEKLVPYLGGFFGTRTSPDVRQMAARLLLQSQRCMELCEDGRGAEGALAAEGTVAVQLVKEVGFGALMAQCGRGVAESVDIPKIALLEFEHDPDDPDAAAATDEDALFAWLSLFSAAHNEFGAALATVATKSDLVDGAFVLEVFAPIITHDDKFTSRVYFEACAALTSTCVRRRRVSVSPSPSAAFFSSRIVFVACLVLVLGLTAKCLPSSLSLPRYAHPHFRSTETNLLMKKEIRAVLNAGFGQGLLHHVNAQSFPFKNAQLLANCLGTISLFFSHEEMKSFFYTSDLKLLVDIVIREVRLALYPVSSQSFTQASSATRPTQPRALSQLLRARRWSPLRYAH